MVLVAQIIVDVPLMQTDRPYSYLVPESMQGQIAIGMRVHVPLVRKSSFCKALSLVWKSRKMETIFQS